MVYFPHPTAYPFNCLEANKATFKSELGLNDVPRKITLSIFKDMSNNFRVNVNCCLSFSMGENIYFYNKDI